MVGRSDDILFSSAGDELVVLHLERGVYHGFDAIGREIWDLLEAPMPVSALCERLLEVYDVEAEVCEQDTLAFLNDAYRRDVITIVPASS